MGFARIKGQLTSRIGRSVRFGPPQDVRTKGGAALQGTIVDEVWADPEINYAPPHKQPCDTHCWGDYSFCSQLIKWSDGTHTYLAVVNRPIFASAVALTAQSGLHRFLGG
jgi:hypothetical protein